MRILVLSKAAIAAGYHPSGLDTRVGWIGLDRDHFPWVQVQIDFPIHRYTCLDVTPGLSTRGVIWLAKTDVCNWIHLGMVRQVT